jgi:hypothetical protein
VAGLVGSRHVIAELTDSKVTVTAAASSLINTSASLILTRQRGQRLTGHMVVGSDLGSASMVTFGCDLEAIRARPDLIVTLFMWWLGA